MACHPSNWVRAFFFEVVKSLTFKVGVTDGDNRELHVDVHILLTYSACV